MSLMMYEGLQAALDGKVGQSAFNQEIQDRIDGDKALQDQIDALDPDGPTERLTGARSRASHQSFRGDRSQSRVGPDHGRCLSFLRQITITTATILRPRQTPRFLITLRRSRLTTLTTGTQVNGGASTWDEITGKPTEFPPEAHNQDWSTITNTPSKYPPEDHTITRRALVDGLELRLDAIEDSITSGGGFVDAPNDGQLYGRQSENWAEIVIPDHLWEQNGSDIYYNNGNVGIGIDSPSKGFKGNTARSLWEQNGSDKTVAPLGLVTQAPICLLTATCRRNESQGKCR